MISPSIAIISTTHGEGHGAETVLEQLLRAWDKERGALFILAPQGSRIYRIANDKEFPYLELKSKRDALIENFRAIRKVVASISNCDLIHAWSARSFELAWWMGKRLRIPAGGTMHDHPCAHFHGLLRRRIMRFSANRLNGMVCVSNAVADACMEAGYDCSYKVIHNGVLDCPAQRAHSNRIRIGFLGMYAEWKGFTIVEQWIRHLSECNILWKLYGSVAPELQSAVECLVHDLPNLVEFQGHKSPEEIFSEIDILAHTSKRFDPFPTVLIEAARAGIPVVASALGGVSEIVIHEETGLIFHPDNPDSGKDMLQRLLASPDLRQKMGVLARQRYETHFRAERMVDEYAQFWQAVLH